MRPLLKALFFTDLLVGTAYAVVVSTEAGDGGLGALGQFAVLLVLLTALFVAGAIAWLVSKAHRRLARATVLLPAAFAVLPFALRLFAGGPVPASFWYTALCVAGAAVIAASVFRPRAVACVVPHRLVRSAFFNWLVLLPTLLGWAALAGLAIWLLGDAGQEAIADANRRSNNTATGIGILAVSAFVIALGTWSTIAATWGWLGIAGGVERSKRKLHLAQLVAAAPGILVAVPLFLWLSGQR